MNEAHNHTSGQPVADDPVVPPERAGHEGHAGHDDHAAHNGHTDHSAHTAHGDHADHSAHAGNVEHTDHADHEGHGGHEGHGDHVGQFRRLFWIMLVLAVPHIARSAWPPSAARLMEPPGVVAEGAGAVPQQATEPPPLPFVFVGAIEDGRQRTAILIEGEQVHLVVARQRIDARYRVDRVLATRIEFTYLPMERKQVLDLAGDPDHGG